MAENVDEDENLRQACLDVPNTFEKSKFQVVELS